jgi:hypothetical protein
MSYQYNKSVVSGSVGAGGITGSFVKLQALGAYDANSVLERIEFGELTDPESDFTPTSTIFSDTTVPNGSCIDGPIARFKVKSGFFFAYSRK